jgi:flagellar hook-length control protein FliK
LEYLPTSYKKTGAADLNEDVDLEATLLVLTDALKAITPATIPDDVATAQNMSEVMALNGLSFAKPLLPEETKLNMTGKEDVALGDALQKETVLRQLLPDKQGVNLSFVENAGSAEKTLVIEKQASLSGIGKEASGVAANVVQFHSPVDNRTDSPAITKPLTHPDWSKDLGEQIVWMNTKALSAAEIRLNPAHLGPISVRIDVNQDQATVMFTAQHAGVKEAIEASIPKLREMLATQQLNLVNVTISQNSTSDQRRSHYQNFSKTPENNEQGIDGVAGITDKIEHDRVVVNKGLLSIYA